MEIEHTVTEPTKNIKIIYPPLYASSAVLGFSILFSPLFGGVLLMQNLRDTDRKNEANQILLYSFLFSVITIILVNIPEEPITSLTMVCNIIGGSLLSNYFYKKYFPNEEKQVKKSIWKPLIISILICIPFVWALIMTME